MQSKYSSKNAILNPDYIWYGNGYGVRVQVKIRLLGRGTGKIRKQGCVNVMDLG